MRKILTFILLLFVSLSAYCISDTIMVDGNNVIAGRTKILEANIKPLIAGEGLIGENFNGVDSVVLSVDKNWAANLFSKGSTAIFVIDTSPSINRKTNTLEYWTDAELKLMSFDKRHTLWVSTQRGSAFGYAASNYATTECVDLGAKIYFTVDADCPANGNDSRNLIEFVWSAQYPTLYAYARYVSKTATPTIGGIEIHIDLAGKTIDGSSISEIFKDAKSIIFLRCSPDKLEQGVSGKCIWRPIKPIYQ